MSFNKLNSLCKTLPTPDTRILQSTALIVILYYNAVLILINYNSTPPSTLKVIYY
jgi:hypothetical protein